MKICLFGLGRIGLPIALTCADSGYKVTGIDINKNLISNLKKGITSFNEPSLNELLKKHVNKSFFPKFQDGNIEEDITDAKYIVIAVGTEFTKYPDKPKLSTLYSIIGQLISAGIKEKTIILRVTLPVGTSDEIKNLIEEKTRFKEGKDFWFAFVPERLMEGKAISEEKSLPKIIGAYTDEGYKKVSDFYKKIGGELIRVSNPRTAEFIKLIDNSWRSTRFAFANELAFLAEKNGIDVMEAIQSANKKYKRNMVPSPGPVSGYCLGKDPYLLELAFEKIEKERDFNSVWYYARLANDWLIDKVESEIKGDSVLIIGLSFKENIDDYRYSHSIELSRKLIKKNYDVMVCDPYLNNNYYTRLPDDIKDKVKSFNDIVKALENKVDTIVFATRHKEYQNIDLNKILKDKKIKQNIKVIDLWNILRKTSHPKIEYKALGKGDFQ